VADPLAHGGSPSISVVMVTYQCASVLRESLGAIVESATAIGAGLDLIIVDNASTDGSVDVAVGVVPAARVIRNRENVGFGRACNQAFAVAVGEYWLLANPDARLEPTALARLVAFARAHPGAGAVAPSLVGAGLERAESAGMIPGLRSALGHFLFLNRLLPDDRGGPWRGVQIRRRASVGPRPVDWASAGLLLVQPAAVRAIGGFDPRYFLYGEDVDLGRRLTLAGWRTWLLPDASVHHAIGGSQGGVSTLWVVGLHDEFGARATRAALVAFDLIVALGLGIRAVVAVTPIARGSRGPHARRMWAAARRALGLAVRTAMGRP
jgi:GT2 family glycosyltransferase